MAVDGALTAGLWFVTLVVQADTGSLGRPVWPAVASASLQVLPLVLRRRHPIIASALVCLGCVAGLFVVDHFRFPDVGFPLPCRPCRPIPATTSCAGGPSLSGPSRAMSPASRGGA